MHQSHSMAETSQIKLLGSVASPFVNRVQFVLNLKSINYEYVEEDFDNKSELLLASNPLLKRVPVLIQPNKPPLCESRIIIDYLEEIFPDAYKLLPSDPADRAVIQFWAYYIDTEFFPLYGRLRKTPDKEGKEALKKQIIEQTRVLEKTFVKFSNGKPYFGGDDVGYLDVILGCFLGWTKFVGNFNNFKILEEIRTPKLVEWSNRILSHEHFKGVIPEQEKLMDFYKWLTRARPPPRVTT
ncbi:hypothetical protein L2E82_42846 [Cichorium intybus]|uniref:Uncharacterized protein n=1 Tax=Cichorium intybus TaxID=13427 RepID=A0ACB8ZLT1_CICIN|nr:hypothetical protein L2E82_42846 [Cichorium intybus]